jgi:putative transposase
MVNKAPQARYDLAPEWSQRQAEVKKAILDLCNDFIGSHRDTWGKTKAVDKFCSHFDRGHLGQNLKNALRKTTRLRPRTIRKWASLYDSRGISGLLEHYGNGGIRIDQDIERGIHRLLWENHLTTPRDCYNDLTAMFGKSRVPSYSTIRRHLTLYREEHWAALVSAHEGTRGLRDRGMACVIGRADADLTEPNQRWEIDTTLADLLTGRNVPDSTLVTGDGRRCKLIGAIEDYSRAPKFFLVGSETGFAVGQCIRACILDWGLAAELVIDNGGPFKNHRIIEFCRELGITLRICNPGSPEEKPHIERAFGTVSRGLFRRLVGYTGNSLQTRPREIEVKYTKDELQKIIDEWVENVYMEDVHSSTGQRPRERLRPPGFIPKTVDPRDLDILLMERHDRKVRNGCVHIDRRSYFHLKLPERQTVQVRVNEFDASEILVFTGGKYLCTAENYVAKGRTPGEIKKARNERNKELRLSVKAHEALLGKGKPKDQRMLDFIDYRKRSKPAELPPRAEVIPFPDLDGATYTGAQGETVEQRPISQEAAPEMGLIMNKREKYVSLMRRKEAGETLDEFDETFLTEFQESPLFGMIRSHLERKVRGASV